MKTVRTTTAAAIVRFLQTQYVRRDGVEHRLINGVAGIFGHGNVTGLGQALEEFSGKSLPFYQSKNEQAMVHMAIAYAKTKQRLGTLACTSPEFISPDVYASAYQVRKPDYLIDTFLTIHCPPPKA